MKNVYLIEFSEGSDFIHNDPLRTQHVYANDFTEALRIFHNTRREIGNTEDYNVRRITKEIEGVWTE